MEVFETRLEEAKALAKEVLLRDYPTPAHKQLARGKLREARDLLDDGGDA
jgi:hypothetical protein